jgi:hypothetical protein
LKFLRELGVLTEDRCYGGGEGREGRGVVMEVVVEAERKVHHFF